MTTPSFHQTPTQCCFASASLVALRNLLKKPDPLDERADCLLLDLKRTQAEEAESVLKTITAALAPQLYLQAEKCWIVATGPITPTNAAKLISEQFLALGYKTVQIAIIQGESLTNSLEELAQAGADLSDDRGVSLLDYKEPPLSLLTNSPATPIAEALSEGAQVVLTHMASPGTMALGAYGSRLAGDTLPIKLAATIASSADLMARQSAYAIPGDILLADTDTQGKCLIEYQGKEAPNNLFEDQQLTAKLPDVSYQSHWVADTSNSLRLESIETALPSKQCDAQFTLAGGYDLNFWVTAPECTDGLNKLNDWKQRIESLQQDELSIQVSPIVEANEFSPRCSVRIEAKTRSQLEEMVKRIELLGLSSSDPISLPHPLLPLIRQKTTSGMTTVPSDGIEFQYKMQATTEWLD